MSNIAYLNYGGTDIPIDLRAAINRRKKQKEVNDRIFDAALATVGFWYEMYKKRLEKYKELKNSLIDINYGVKL